MEAQEQREKIIEKRFPATVALNEQNFLNDHKIDGELYALLMQYSYGVNKQTRVYKSDLPSQNEMCKILGIGTTKTLRAHRDYLIKRGYLIEYDTYYEIPKKESVYFMIPLKTLQYMNDTLKEQVIKIYIYLGQRWKYKQDYCFTIKEIGEHIGLRVEGNGRHYVTINNALDALKCLGFINYEDCYENIGNIPIPKKKLTMFKTER